MVINQLLTLLKSHDRWVPQQHARNAMKDAWLKGPNRKPVVLRGARQVGKTRLVQDFALRNQRELIELNLEKYPNLAAGKEPVDALAKSIISFNMEILLFPLR